MIDVDEQVFAQTNAGIPVDGAKRFYLPFGIWLVLAGCFRMYGKIDCVRKVVR